MSTYQAIFRYISPFFRRRRMRECARLSGSTSLPILLKSIASIHNDITGWCELEKAEILAALCYTTRPARIVEIGVFGGKSLIPMALAMKAAGGDCEVVGIDPWSKSAATEGYDGANLEWWSSVDLDRVHNSFLTLRDQLGLSIRVIRAKSDHVEWSQPIGVLHIDGQHTEQAVRDVLRYAVHVVPSGYVVVDDIGWVNQGATVQVLDAVGELIALGFVELYKLGTGAVFQRTVSPVMSGA
jgi:hypothetical protein